jgi:hypothetical protein
MHQLLRAWIDGGNTDADGDLHLAITERSADLLGPFAQRFGEFSGVSEFGGQQNAEAIAGYARANGPGRQAAANQLTDMREHPIAERHAIVVIDDVQPVDVDEQGTPGSLNGL